MIGELMNDMMTGAIAMGFAIASLFFLRFWRQSGERLFAFFAVSFLILALNRVAFVLLADHGVRDNLPYWIRVAAFMLILAGILDKNRTRRCPLFMTDRT